MGSRFNLELLPIHRKDGHDQPDLPGVHVGRPPRRAPRARSGDQLIVMLSFTGTATIAPEGQRKILKGLAETYFQTPGAVTSAMRSAVESLNTFLLDRNLNNARTGLQATGYLTLITLREERVYVAQSGLTHIFSIRSKGIQHLFDPLLSGRGLGLRRSASVRYEQIFLENGDLMIISPDPPPTWTPSALRGGHNRKLDSIHRGLLKGSPDDLSALVVQVQSGKGKIRQHKPLPTPETKPESTPESQSEAKSSVSPAAVVEKEVEEQPTAKGQPPPKRHVEAAERPDARAVEKPVKAKQKVNEAGEGPKKPLPIAEPSAPSSQRKPKAGAPSSSTSPTSRPEDKKTPAKKPPRPNPVRAALRIVGPMILAIARAFRDALLQLGRATRVIISRLLPGNEIFTIPSSVMAFTAIAVPLVIVTIASVVYMQRGRGVQYQTSLEQAQAAKLYAEGQTTPAAAHQGWDAVLFYLDQAETFQITDQSQALRAEAVSNIDEIDQTERLDFQPAIVGGLPVDVHVQRMVATSDEIYLLDTNEGRVIRAWLTGRGYELDTTFNCGPGSYGSYLVGELVDIAPLPKGNEFGAAVLAIDKNGILVYCIPDKAPIAAPLVPPDSNWGEPIAFTLSDGDLSILDPKTNAVWVYFGNRFTFTERPRFFFDEEVPSLKDAIDLTTNKGDLYLLEANGQVITCSLNFGPNPTPCNDPAPFTDTRQGFENGPVITGATFTQIAYTPPPEPSIYLLDPIHQAIYHFSLRLTFQRQLRPAYALTSLGEATAFTIGPNRSIFMAFGDEVYVAPPR